MTRTVEQVSAEPAVAAAGAVPGVRKPRVKYGVATVVAVVALGLLAVGIGWSVAIGPTSMDLGTIVKAVVVGGNSTDAAIVHGIRLPRAVLAILVGADCAVAGVIMQAVTANSLGAPEILGVNAGAAFVAVASLTFATGLSGVGLVPLAMLGAAICGVLVMVTAGLGRGRTDPVRIVLAGVTLTTVIFSVMQAMIILVDPATSSLFHWLVGGVNVATWADSRTVLPWTVVGLIGAMALAGKLNVLGLGEDLARGLGIKVGRVRGIGALLVIVLAGASVAVAGPITFVGLVVPHIVRKLVGVNHYVVLPLSALLGATMLLYADIVSRYINPPSEVPSGVVTAFIGAPFFIYLARKQKGDR